MAEGASSLERELEAEVRDSEISLARLEGQLDEKRSLLARLRLATLDSQPTAEHTEATTATPVTASAPADRAAATAAAQPGLTAAPASQPEATPSAPAAAAAPIERPEASPPTPAAPALEAQPSPQARARNGAAAVGRHTISVLGKHHYEVNGLRFPNAGQMLDHLDVPHYFSRKYPKQGDAAAREVMRWAKRNPSLAGGVTVVLADGARMGLDAAVRQVWP